MATRLPSGRYRTQVLVGTENGKRKYKSFTADTAKKADLLALQWQAEHPTKRISGHTVGSALHEYIGMKSAVLSPSTLRSYKAMERNLKDRYKTVSRMKLDMLDEKTMQGFVNEMSSVSSPKTVRNYYGLLGAVLKQNGLAVPFADCLRR